MALSEHANSAADCRISSRTAIAAALAVAWFSGGCSSGDDIRKVVVQGSVAFHDKPLPNGQIMFYPIGETRGPVSVALISEGKYIAELRGGVPIGKHQVKIEGYRRPTVAPPGMSLEDLGREQYLPAKYNTQSELTTELNDDESPAQRDFALDASS